MTHKSLQQCRQNPVASITCPVFYAHTNILPHTYIYLRNITVGLQLTAAAAASENKTFLPTERQAKGGESVERYTEGREKGPNQMPAQTTWNALKESGSLENTLQANISFE